MSVLKVSIIVNNFNYGRFVSTAVESALAQTYSQCEVIVVDDGSTDESVQVLRGFKERIRLLLKENGGQASAFNAGLLASQADLIAFLDSDDALLPEAIETAVKAWQNDLVKVQFPLEIMDDAGQPTGLMMPRGRLSAGNLMVQFLKTGRYVTSPTSGNVYSREFLEKIFPIPETEWAETGDGYINTCAPFYGRIEAIMQPLGFYRIHGKSMSSVAHAGLDVGQMKKLMRHAMLEKALLERLGGDRGLTPSKRIVVSHWMHLKLKMSLDKLTDVPGVNKPKVLLQSACAMFVSVWKADELTLLRKVQHILWAFSVALLPTGQATKFIEYAFDRAPDSRFSRFLRRV